MEDIIFVKLVSGDTCIGIKDEDKNVLKDVAVVQAVPVGNSGIQIAILPFGFPYEEDISGEVPMDKVLYTYKELPDDMKNRYIEAKSNIRIAGAGELGGFGGGSQSSGGIIF
jgi:hypothetical protein